MAAEPLAQAANARHQRAVERAERALRDLDREGAAISFQSVAQRARVSRQWLYTQPVLRAEIERLRERKPTSSESVSARQRATEASLRQRLETLRAEIQRLREENAGLKAELTKIRTAIAQISTASTFELGELPLFAICCTASRYVGEGKNIATPSANDHFWLVVARCDHRAIRARAPRR